MNRRSIGFHVFTLIELLVVIAIIAILASILLPSLNRARNKVKAVSCLNQMKQITFAQEMYQQDNNGYLATAIPPGNKDWFTTLSPYLNKKLKLWLCPATSSPTKSLDILYTDATSYNTFKMQAGIGINGWGFRGRDNSNNLVIPKISRFKKPSLLVYSADARTGTECQNAGGNPSTNGLLYLRPDVTVAPVEGQPDVFSYYIRHEKIINSSFLDGHAEGVGSTVFLSWCRIAANQQTRFIGQ